MLSEITRAITDAIRAHQETALSGFFGIGGTIAGATLSFIFERWRSRGSVKIFVVSAHCHFVGNAKNANALQAVGPSDAKQVHHDFCLRVLNSYPIPKSLALISIEFFAAKKRHPGKPLLTDTSKLIWTTSDASKVGDDVGLPAHSFTRISIEGTGVKADETANLNDVVTAWRAIRIRFLVSPKHTLDFWHVPTEAELTRVPPEPEPINLGR